MLDSGAFNQFFILYGPPKFRHLSLEILHKIKSQLIHAISESRIRNRL